MVGWVRPSIKFLATVLLAVICCGSVQAHEFRITRVTRLPKGFSAFEFGLPAINDRGQIAFRSLRGGVDGVFLKDGARIRRVGRSTGSQRYLSGDVSLNERGQVAFQESGNEGWNAIYRGSGGRATRIADVTGPFRSLGMPSINDGGDVAFLGQLADFSLGIFQTDGGEVQPVHLTDDPLIGLSAPSLNNSGEVAFFQQLADGRQQEILKTEFELLTVADTAGPFRFLRPPTLNNLGIVAFYGGLDNDQSGIYTGRVGTVTPIADTTHAFTGFEENVALNDRGQAAFTAGAFGGGGGLFLADGPDVVPVLRIGQKVDGSTVEVIGLSREGLNNRGQLTFAVLLNNRRVGIYLATPWPRAGSAMQQRKPAP